MNEKKDPRNKAVFMRFTSREFEIIEKRFKNSTCRKFSEYGRKILLDQPVTFNHRNASLDEMMVELIQLRNQLNNAAGRFEKACEKLHQINGPGQLPAWLSDYESDRKIMLDQIRIIHEYISQTGRKWLQ